MSAFGRALYGDPCRGCGYHWSTSAAEADAIVAALPAAVDDALVGADGTEVVSGLTWPTAAYVAHIADNLHIWSERLVAVAAGSDAAVASYDQDQLGATRSYTTMPLVSARWSLGRAATLLHPEQGPLALDDVARMVSHDGFHHVEDLRRVVAATRARASAHPATARPRLHRAETSGIVV